MATRIGELKKPSVPVWTVNQLAHREPKRMKGLVDAGTDVRAAQEKSAGDRLRDAIGRHNEALSDLVGRAEGILREAGRSATRDAVDRVWSTLRAGSLDPEFQKLLAAGRLDQEIESSGFPVGLTLQPAGGADKRARSQRTRREAVKEARDDVKEKHAEVQEARKRVRELEAAEKRAVTEADKARDALAQAEEALADARARVERSG